LVVGEEDPVKKKLMINVESIVREWHSGGRQMLRTVKKLLRKKCK